MISHIGIFEQTFVIVTTKTVTYISLIGVCHHFYTVKTFIAGDFRFTVIHGKIINLINFFFNFLIFFNKTLDQVCKIVNGRKINDSDCVFNILFFSRC